MARPKREFSDEQINEMQNYAFNGCQNNTIATLMDIPIETLVRRFGKLLTKKRAERKWALRMAQTSKAIDSKDTGMLCFLGKNELGQTDKQTTELNLSKATATLLGLIDGSSKGKLPTNRELENE